MATNSVIIPPPPYLSPFTDRNGLITPIWSKWINQIYLRIGGASSPSTEGIVSDITTLQSNVATLETEVNTLNSEISPLTGGISMGRQL